jgi:hypothetical protein
LAQANAIPRLRYFHILSHLEHGKSTSLLDAITLLSISRWPFSAAVCAGIDFMPLPENFVCN